MASERDDPMLEEALSCKRKRTSLQESAQPNMKEGAERIRNTEQSVLNPNVYSSSLSVEGGTQLLLMQDSEKAHTQKKTATSSLARVRLSEICDANGWDSPSFALCKEEGPEHQKMFTFKVTVQVDGISSTKLEVFSEPKRRKRAAQDHAAEGALWYLNHLGYLPKS